MALKLFLRGERKTVWVEWMSFQWTKHSNPGPARLWPGAYDPEICPLDSRIFLKARELSTPAWRKSKLNIETPTTSAVSTEIALTLSCKLPYRRANDLHIDKTVLFCHLHKISFHQGSSYSKLDYHLQLGSFDISVLLSDGVSHKSQTNLVTRFKIILCKYICQYLWRENLKFKIS